MRWLSPLLVSPQVGCICPGPFPEVRMGNEWADPNFRWLVTSTAYMGMPQRVARRAPACRRTRATQVSFFFKGNRLYSSCTHQLRHIAMLQTEAHPAPAWRRMRATRGYRHRLILQQTLRGTSAKINRLTWAGPKERHMRRQLGYVRARLGRLFFNRNKFDKLQVSTNSQG